MERTTIFSQATNSFLTSKTIRISVEWTAFSLLSISANIPPSFLGLVILTPSHDMNYDSSNQNAKMWEYDMEKSEYPKKLTHLVVAELVSLDPLSKLVFFHHHLY